MKTKTIKDYKSKLDIYETQTAIGFLKRVFEDKLSSNLNLKRVSAPLFVKKSSGLNDNLNGVERPVAFSIKNSEEELEIVHSLAKWKRLALHLYNFKHGEGLYTDMNAIRRDEDLDNLHSVYVDQWDWERVISKEERNVEFLQYIVKQIVNAIYYTNCELKKKFPQLTFEFEDQVHFITTNELEQMYPTLTPKEREYECVKKFGNSFIMKIGGNLANGQPHDGRAPDYDDWDLNGDIVCYNKTLDIAFEISSMGIRVDQASLLKQLEIRNCLERKELDFHKMLLEGKLPLTIGGGIGQSRLSMLLLEKAHIGEVQVSVWDDETKEECAKNNIYLL